MPYRLLPLLALVACLAGCGGGGEGAAAGEPVTMLPAPAPSPAASAAPVAPVPASAPLVATIRLAQTHVVPAAGSRWVLGGQESELHLVGGRAALALVTLEGNARDPVIEGLDAAGASLGTVALARASLRSEAGAPAFPSGELSAELPAAWIAPGLRLVVRAADRAPATPVAVTVGVDASLTLRILPFYLFGANPANTVPLAEAQMPDAAVRRELFARWPVARLAVATHGAGQVSWDRIVVPPRTANGVNEPAYTVSAMDQQRDGQSVMAAVLTILSRLRAANGEANTDSQYYAPLLALDSAGRPQDMFGGLSVIGGGASVGDHRFTGVFFHELGHGFGLQHAADAFAAGSYPYAGGSLDGSTWAYDPGTRELLGPLVPQSAPNYATCRMDHRLDAGGACFRQDPMQGGAGDQGASYAFSVFADHHAARIQHWFEGSTSVAATGAHLFTGGRIFIAADGSATHWDAIARARVAMPADATGDLGALGVNAGLPVARDVPVHAIVVSFSRAGTPGASIIYPPLRFTGNLIRTFDPDVAADMAAIRPDGTGAYRWYCEAYGCDYTLRVTYDDGSVVQRVLQGAFRSWFGARDPLPATATDPRSDASFRTWAVNVPSARAIARVELLDTPMAWNGVPERAAVLLSR